MPRSGRLARRSCSRVPIRIMAKVRAVERKHTLRRVRAVLLFLNAYTYLYQVAGQSKFDSREDSERDFIFCFNAHVQSRGKLQRRPCRAAAGGPGANPRRIDGLPWHGDVSDGDEPPLEGIRRNNRARGEKAAGADGYLGGLWGNFHAGGRQCAIHHRAHEFVRWRQASRGSTHRDVDWKSDHGTEKRDSLPLGGFHGG